MQACGILVDRYDDSTFTFTNNGANKQPYQLDATEVYIDFVIGGILIP